jgi:hypothetical protein
MKGSKAVAVPADKDNTREPLLARVAAAAKAANRERRGKAAASLHQLAIVIKEFQLGIDGVPDHGDATVTSLLTEAREMR